MGEVRKHRRVKLFVGILYEKEEVLSRAIDAMVLRFGDIDYKSKEFPFDFTDYYKDIGKQLRRLFVSFRRLIYPSMLSPVKHFTNRVEGFSSGGKRWINLDPGYIDGAKVVLASTKDYSHRIYLSNGIYGEVTLRYMRGEYIPFDYTYPDYRRTETHDFFKLIRRSYLNQVKENQFDSTYNLNLGILLMDEAEHMSEVLKREGKTIVMTNGCFDILHRGHIFFLKKAKSLGDVLFVAVNSDSSVRRLKGSDRPVVPEESRIEVLSSLRFVDYVVPFEELTAERVVSVIKPDIYVKGKEYEGKGIPEEHVVKSYGGKVLFLDILSGWSTTDIIKKVRGIEG